MYSQYSHLPLINKRSPISPTYCPSDGVVFDGGHPEAKEEGGRIYAVEYKGKEAFLSFGRRDFNLQRVHVGDKIWKTSDPELDKQLRQSFKE